MIDFHNHILPGVDDGSNSIEMSLDMLRVAHSQGVTDVINTVHYQHPKVEFQDLGLVRMTKEISKLQAELDINNIPVKIHNGAEVYYLPNLVDIAKNDPQSTMGLNKYMLIEFQIFQLPIEQKEQLYNLKINGITPIIAHPERYKFVQRNIDIVFDWLQSGCVIQVDAASIFGGLGSSAKKHLKLF